jgi:osmotically-inducible protein OsmY
MKANGSLLAGVGAGAAVAYFLDPAYGPRRRARLRDQVVHTATLTRRAIGTTSRDALHRTSGTAASLAHLMQREEVDDNVLVERVRAKLGRLVSHPRAIDVLASDGVVMLKGQILKHERKNLLRAIRHVRGIVDVIDALEVHK